MNTFNLGIISGFIIVFVIILGLFLFYKKKNQSIFQEFDERQLLARSNAYSTACLTIILFIVADGLLKLTGIYWYEEPFGEFAIIFIALIIFAWKAIMSDAFFDTRSQKNNQLFKICYFIIGVSQFTIALTNLDELIVNGKVSMRAISLISGIVFISISLFMTLHDKKVQNEEDE